MSLLYSRELVHNSSVSLLCLFRPGAMVRALILGSVLPYISTDSYLWNISLAPQQSSRCRYYRYNLFVPPPATPKTQQEVGQVCRRIVFNYFHVFPSTTITSHFLHWCYVRFGKTNGRQRFWIIFIQPFRLLSYTIECPCPWLLLGNSLDLIRDLRATLLCRNR